MINDLHITYFDPMKMHGGLALTGNYYDTGASFYEYIYANKLNYKIINAKDYILHKEGGSWK